MNMIESMTGAADTQDEVVETHSEDHPRQPRMGFHLQHRSDPDRGRRFPEPADIRACHEPFEPLRRHPFPETS